MDSQGLNPECTSAPSCLSWLVVRPSAGRNDPKEEARACLEEPEVNESR